MEEEVNMYSNMFGPRALIALGVFLVLGTGCAELKKTDAVKSPETRVNQAAHTDIPSESVDLTGPLLDEIVKLKAQITTLQSMIQSEKQIGQDNYQRINDLTTKCGHGAIGKGSNYPVFTAERAEDVTEYNYSRYSNGEQRPDLPPKVKHIKFTPKSYPDVICLDDTVGTGSTCFDPMELTER